MVYVSHKHHCEIISIMFLEDTSDCIDSLIRTVIFLNLFLSYTHLEASIDLTGDPINRLKG